MSKEFEEIVLKKLDNTDKVINEIVLKKLDNLENEVIDTKKGLKDLAKDTNQRLENVELGLKDTKEVVRDLRQRITVFDFEINRKIDTLFDSDTVNKDNIVSLNTKTYNHDTRISNLENKDLHLVKS